MYKKIGILLVSIGILIITWALYVRWDTNQKQKVMISEFNAAVDTHISEEEAKKTPGDDLPEKVLGILSIPKIQLKVSIEEGIDDNRLKYAVGHFKETAKPGEKGNCAIAGHRSFTYNKFFNRLDELDAGDEIWVKTLKGEFKYIIFEKKIIEPTETSVLNNTDDTTITLITCHPERSSAYRLIVKGRLEKEIRGNTVNAS